MEVYRFNGIRECLPCAGRELNGQRRAVAIKVFDLAEVYGARVDVRWVVYGCM
jgi:hypothetical protein